MNDREFIILIQKSLPKRVINLEACAFNLSQVHMMIEEHLKR